MAVAVAASAAAGAGGGSRVGGGKGTGRAPKEMVEKKAGVNQEYDSFMEEMKGLGAF